jgi:predicted ATPase
MPRYVLTGAPGAGKTAILRQLECQGYPVVEESATDVIALEHALGQPEPSASPDFADKIVLLQQRRERQLGPAGDGDRAVFFDRSQVCTLALSRFLGRPASALLVAEVDRVVRERVYAPTVFFVRNRGVIVPTAARRISFADSLAFEDVHERTYRELGFRLVDVPAGPLRDRVELICDEAGVLVASG